jgi:hypothetical protein
MAGGAARSAEEERSAIGAISFCWLCRSRGSERADKCDELPDLHVFEINAGHLGAWNSVVYGFEESSVGRSEAVFAACQIGAATAFALQTVTFSAVER